MTTVFLIRIGIMLYLVIDNLKKPNPNQTQNKSNPPPPPPPPNMSVEPLAGVLKMAFFSGGVLEVE